MDIDLLRKRLQEIRESIAAGTMPAVPGFEVLNQPAAPSQPVTPSPVDTYKPSEATAPSSQPQTTPTSANTPPTPVSVSNPATPRTTPAAVSTPKIDPKKGVNGAKVFADIAAKRPTLGENSIKDLIDAYNAGYNDTDINEEIKANASAGNYMPEIEAVINAGKADASAKLVSDKASKDLSTDAARHEQILRMQNIKQAQKLAHTSDDLGDLTTEGARKEKLLQKNIDNIGKPVYNSDNTTENGDGNKTESGDTGFDKLKSMGFDANNLSKWEKDYQVAKTEYENSPGELFNPIPSGTYDVGQGAHGDDEGHDFQVGGDNGLGTPIFAAADGELTYYARYGERNGKTGYRSYGLCAVLTFKINGQNATIICAHMSPEYMNDSGFLSKKQALEDIPNYKNGSGFTTIPEIELGNRTVKAGEIIGFVGSTGNSSGPHMHFVLKINGKCITNASDYFSGWGKS